MKKYYLISCGVHEGVFKGNVTIDSLGRQLLILKSAKKVVGKNNINIQKDLKNVYITDDSGVRLGFEDSSSGEKVYTVLQSWQCNNDYEAIEKYNGSGRYIIYIDDSKAPEQITSIILNERKQYPLLIIDHYVESEHTTYVLNKNEIMKRIEVSYNMFEIMKNANLYGYYNSDQLILHQEMNGWTRG